MPLLVWADEGTGQEQAQALAQRLKTELVWKQPSWQSLVLRLDANGLALGHSGMASQHMLRADFSRLLPRLQTQRLQAELLVRAAKIRYLPAAVPVAVDATAGLGEDSLLLAAAGYEVHLCEHNAIIAVLLEDALARAKMLPELAALCSRMHLHQGDSIAYLQQLSVPPDLILLDPMFPPRRKSAMVKKKFQLLQMVEQPCADETALLQAALAVQPRKLVIKRPLKGLPLAGVKPSYSLAGKTIRYDCLQVRR